MKSLHPERWKIRSATRPQKLPRTLFYRQFASSRARWTDDLEATALPSPNEESVLSSAKLYALRARLNLPESFAIQTLARCLVHPTADPDPRFNNQGLSILGGDVLGYYTAEYLLCNYPRLPMAVLFAAQNGFVGPTACAAIVKDWGVEAAAVPGGEVEPGLLQFRRIEPGSVGRINNEDITRATAYRYAAPTGFGSRIVANDQFGDWGTLPRTSTRKDKPIPESLNTQSSAPTNDTEASLEDAPPAESVSETTPVIDSAPLQTSSIETQPLTSNVQAVDLVTASTSFFRALTGALHLHTSATYTASFHAAHVLSRHLDVSSLFDFKAPTRDLSRLCAREGFEAPVARLLSHTGKHSIAPVFVVGVYSGFDKLGEGAGSSLVEARNRASVNALRSWYLYRPSDPVRPSEAEIPGKVWKPNFIDLGEVVT